MNVKPCASNPRQLYDCRILFHYTRRLVIYNLDGSIDSSFLIPYDKKTTDISICQLDDGRLAIATHYHLYIYSLKGNMDVDIQHTHSKPYVKKLTRDKVAYNGPGHTVVIINIPHHIPLYTVRADRLCDVTVRFD